MWDGPYVPPSDLPPVSRADALERMTRSLEIAKQARDRGLDIKEARRLLKHARSAFERGEYAAAAWFADQLMRLFGYRPPWQ